MNASRFLYRSRQFLQAFSTRSSPQDMELLTSILSPAQVELFQQMQKSERAHSLIVLDELMTQGEENPDLMTAALLHDAGKTRAPIRLWERVMIVIVRVICQNCIQKWGTIDIDNPEKALGWRRAFIVAEQHPDWGADLAAGCGTSPLAVSLIARHQEPLSPGASSLEDILLKKLQAVDGKN
jgi:hypothetical protein